MERQHQSTKSNNINKSVHVTAAQRLANEEKCWRFHGIPIFSINDITRSLSEEFKRLGESKMIFVEGGAIGIARVIHKLNAHGLSENEEKSHYLVYRKCEFNEPFTIKNGGDDIIVFDGVALRNEHGEMICERCFKLGMIVVDCDHQLKEVASTRIKAIMQIYNIHRGNLLDQMRLLQQKQQQLTMTEQGKVLEIFTALEDESGRTFCRNDTESMIILSEILSIQSSTYTIEDIREISSRHDNDGYDCVRLTEHFDRVEGFIECKNHMFTPLTKNDLGIKALRMTSSASNSSWRLGKVGYSFCIGPGTMCGATVDSLAQDNISDSRHRLMKTGNEFVYGGIRQIDYNGDNATIIGDRVNAKRVDIIYAVNNDFDGKKAEPYYTRDWVIDALPKMMAYITDTPPKQHSGSKSYEEMVQSIFHVNAFVGAGKTAFIAEGIKEIKKRNEKFLVVLSKNDDAKQMRGQFRMVFGTEEYNLLKIDHITDRKTTPNKASDVVLLNMACCNAASFGGTQFSTIFIDESHKMTTSYQHTSQSSNLYRDQLLEIMSINCNHVVALTATPFFFSPTTIDPSLQIIVTHADLQRKGFNVQIIVEVLLVSKETKERAVQLIASIDKNVTLMICRHVDECDIVADYAKKTGFVVYRRYGEHVRTNPLPNSFSSKSLIVTIRTDVQATDRRQIAHVIFFNEPNPKAPSAIFAQGCGRGVRPNAGKFYMLLTMVTTTPTYSDGLCSALSSICVSAGMNIADLKFIGMRRAAQVTVSKSSGEQRIHDVCDDDIADEINSVDTIIMFRSKMVEAVRFMKQQRNMKTEELNNHRAAQKAQKLESKLVKAATQTDKIQDLNDYIALHGRPPPATIKGRYKQAAWLWVEIQKNGSRILLKESLQLTTYQKWPALSEAWLAYDNLMKSKNAVMEEPEAMKLLINGTANPLNLVLRMGHKNRSSVDMNRLRSFFLQNDTFHVVLDKRTFPMAEEGKRYSAMDIMKMVPHAREIAKISAQKLATKYGFAPLVAFGGYKHCENFEDFLKHAIHFDQIMHREPVLGDGNEDFYKEYKLFMNLENLISTAEGREVFLTLSSVNFRTQFQSLVACVAGRCHEGGELFSVMYHEEEHRSSCPLGQKTCLVCFMQCLDAARDNVELKTQLLTNGSKLANRYLACRDNLYIDAHARKLLMEIKMKSGADHTSYCVVTAARGCVWCLDDLRNRQTTLTTDEAARVKQFETDIEASADTKRGSRGLVVRRSNDISSSSTDKGHPLKKQKRS